MATGVNARRRAGSSTRRRVVIGQRPNSPMPIATPSWSGVRCRGIGRCREGGMQPEAAGELLCLGCSRRPPDLLQGDHIGVHGVQGSHQAVLPILPAGPEPPPDVPGHHPRPAGRDIAHGLALRGDLDNRRPLQHQGATGGRTPGGPDVGIPSVVAGRRRRATDGFSIGQTDSHVAKRGRLRSRSAHKRMIKAHPTQRRMARQAHRLRGQA